MENQSNCHIWYFESNLFNNHCNIASGTYKGWVGGRGWGGW